MESLRCTSNFKYCLYPSHNKYKCHFICIDTNEMAIVCLTCALVCEYIYANTYVFYHSNIFLEIVKRIKYTKSNQNIFIQRPTIRSVVCKYDTRINPIVCELNSFHKLQGLEVPAEFQSIKRKTSLNCVFWLLSLPSTFWCRHI